MKLGDTVAILSHTRIRWVEADVAILHAGAAMVPIYPSLKGDVVAEILEDSGARVLFAEDPVQLAKLAPYRERLGGLERVILFDRVSRLERPDAQGRLDVSMTEIADELGIEALSVDSLIERGEAFVRAEPDELAARRAAVRAETVAAVYYTSGTEGEPKGVVLTHANFVAETRQLREVMPVGPSDEQLLFLPLAHIVAKLTMMLQLRVGFITSFAASIDEAAADCAKVRPTFIVGVPRVYEKIQEAILAGSVEGGPVKERAFAWAMGVGRRAAEAERAGETKKIGAMLELQRRSAERAVFARIKARLGGRIRFMLSGAAPLSVETAEFFAAIGLLILEGYGLTETTGACTLNLPHDYRFGTVGRPLPAVQIRIAEDGEVLVRSPGVTPRYHGRPDATARAFAEDGYFRTGDIGWVDDDGFLTITDRKKDLIITAGGKNVAPQRIESRLCASELIERAIVLGDRRKFPVALLTLSGDAVRAWSKEHGLSDDLIALTRHPRLRDLISREVERVNDGLASFESVKRFEIIVADISVASGLLTPTGKVRRNAVAERYADIVDALYEGVTVDLDDLS